MELLHFTLAAARTSRASSLFESLELALRQPHAGSILRALFILGIGAVGVYLMLPRGQPAGRRRERYVGGALATLALVLLITVPFSRASPGSNAKHASGSPPTDSDSADTSHRSDARGTVLWAIDDQPKVTCYTFHLLAFVSLASAVMMITSRNPVYSALWFALVLLGNSGLFLLQGAEFLSAATIIVYAGAIVVTFLFVIMLAQPTGTARYDRHSREPLLVTATGLVLASVLVGTLHYSARFEEWGRGLAGTRRPSSDAIATAANERGKFPGIADDHVAGLGKTLFVDHVASVEVIGVILLAAVVGAMLIAGHKVEAPPGRRSG